MDAEKALSLNFLASINCLMRSKTVVISFTIIAQIIVKSCKYISECVLL